MILSKIDFKHNLILLMLSDIWLNFKSDIQECGYNNSVSFLLKDNLSFEPKQLKALRSDFFFKPIFKTEKYKSN